MDLTFTVSAVSAGAAVVAAIAASGAWRAGNRSAKLTEIELERRHSELSPMFGFGLDRSGGGRQSRLTVSLNAPAALGRLDEITMTIRDDVPDRAQLAVATGSTVPPEDVARQIWGPLRFVHGVDGGSSDGRTVTPFALPVGESRPFALEPTLAPPWSNSQAGWWENQYAGKPLRLTLECRREGYEPWTVKVEVPLEPSATSQIW